MEAKNMKYVKMFKLRLGKHFLTLNNFKKYLIFINRKYYSFNAKIMNYEKNICRIICSISIRL